MAIDPARFGDDDSAVALRRGRVVYPLYIFKKIDLVDLARQIARIIKTSKPNMVPDLITVDDAGLGGGLTDILRDMGFKVNAVNAGSTAINDGHYSNRRAEMYGELLLWLKDAPCSLPDNPILSGELTATQYKYDNKSRLQLEKKEDLKKRIGRSPDRADAVALTFAEYVPMTSADEYEEVPVTKTGRSKTSGY